MAAQACQRVDLRATADLTHFLFFNESRGKDSVGDDLVARWAWSSRFLSLCHL